MKEEMTEQPQERDRKAYRAPRQAKAPWLLRLVSWSAVMLLLFTLGYFGTGLALKWVDRKEGPAETKIVSGKEPVPGASAGASQTGYKVYSLKGDRIIESRASTNGGVMEADLREVMKSLFGLLKVEGLLDPQATVLHVFRTGDLLYLDVNDACIRSITSLPKEKANLVMTGIVRTAIDNFRPLSRVRFLVNGKESQDKQPVDLTVAWQLSRKP
jgi:hypothetical protein